jgi:hypothetical protein
MKQLAIAALGICLSMNALGQGFVGQIDTFTRPITITTPFPACYQNGSSTFVAVYHSANSEPFSVGPDGQQLSTQVEGGVSFSTPKCEPVPELDGAGAILGLGLVGALVAVYRERRRRIKVSSPT